MAAPRTLRLAGSRQWERRTQRIRDLLVSVFPGLERVVDVTGMAGLHLLTRYVTPAEIRPAGKARMTAHLNRAGRVRQTTVDAPATAGHRCRAGPAHLRPG